MRSKTRRYFTSEKKAQIVGRHLADKVEVSNLADEIIVPVDVGLFQTVI